MKLIEIASICTGHPFRGKISENLISGNIRVIQMKDMCVEGDSIDWDGLTITTLVGKKRADWIIKDDILFLAKGSKNYSVLVDREVAGVVGAPYLYILRLKTERILPAFLAWQLNQKPLQDYFSRSAQGSLAKSINRSVIEETEIIIPPLERQEGIVKLYRFALREKAVYTQLIHNSDELMASIAKDLIDEEKKSEYKNKPGRH